MSRYKRLRCKKIVSRCAPENRSHSANWLNSVTISTYRSVYTVHKKFVAPLLATTVITYAITLIEYRRAKGPFFGVLSIVRQALAASISIRQSLNERVSNPLTTRHRCL